MLLGKYLSHICELLVQSVLQQNSHSDTSSADTSSTQAQEEKVGLSMDTYITCIGLGDTTFVMNVLSGLYVELYW